MPDKLEGHPLFHSIRADNAKLYAEKHRMYATDANPMSNFTACGVLIDKLLKPGVNRTLAAALTLMSKQIVGVYEIVGEQKANTLESLEDKLRDIEIYATICQVLLRDPKAEVKAKVYYKPIRFEVEDPKKIDGPYCDHCGALAELRSERTNLYYCQRCADVYVTHKEFTAMDGGR